MSGLVGGRLVEKYSVLTVRLRRMYEGRGVSCVCRRCGRLIRVGSRFVIKIGSRSGSTKRYHEDCWSSLFLDFD